MKLKTMATAKKVLWPIGLILVFGVGIFAGKWAFSTDYVAPPNATPFTTTNAEALEGGSAEYAVKSTGRIIEVKDGSSIQEAVLDANAGDLIRVFPGTYSETVYIDKDNITFQGVIDEGDWPTLDGKKELNDGFLYSGNGIVIENFKIINYKGNGIMGQAGNNFVLRNNWVIDAGVYGIFPEFGQNGLIESNVLSGIEDAAIYVGMCDNIDVRSNEVFNSVAGIEIENSRHALVENNYAHDNTGGILVFITPGLPIKTCFDVILRNNFVVNNNTPNFGAPGSIVAGIPAGTGILVMAADDVVIENNIITGNDNAGIAITDHGTAGLTGDADSEPYPDRVTLLDNFMQDNGNNPVGEVKAAMLTKLDDKGPDIIAIGSGEGCTIKNPGRYRTFGIGDYGISTRSDTKDVSTYLMANPVAPRALDMLEKGELTYYGVCTGCHAYNVRLIGPPTKDIQVMYPNNPEGIVEYITNPVHKRPDYPEMPPQNYLSEETRMAVAQYILTVTE
jgi:parallel beta-helix repeat protein